MLLHSTGPHPANLPGCARVGLGKACRVLGKVVHRDMCSLGVTGGCFPLWRGAGLVPPAQSYISMLSKEPGAEPGNAEGVAPWADSTWKLQWKSLTPFSPAEV